MSQRKKHILVTIDWYSPGYKAGGPTRSCVNLIDLLKDDYDFSIITRNTDYCETTPYEGITPDEWFERDGVRIIYLSKSNTSVKAFEHILYKEDYDIIYVNGIFSFYFSILPLYTLKNIKSIRKIVAARGMLAPAGLQQKGFKKSLYLSLAKMFGLYNDVEFQATKEEEQQDIHNIFPDNRVTIVKNIPDQSGAKELNTIPKQKGELRLIHLSRVAPEKNTLYALKVLQRLGKRGIEGSIQFDIYGQKYDEEYWQLCEEVIAETDSRIQVTYCGMIPANQVPRIVRNYHASFLPTKGENYGHAIVESFMAGRPVVISDKTPWTALEQEKTGWSLPLNDIGKFSDVLEELLHMSKPELEEYQNAAFQKGQAMKSDPETVTDYHNLFAE